MTIFTIIVTYNAMQRGWIDRCLKSLAESTAPTTAIVIDNGSKQYINTQTNIAVFHKLS